MKNNWLQFTASSVMPKTSTGKLISLAVSYVAVVYATCIILQTRPIIACNYTTENCKFEDYVLGKHVHQEDPCLVTVFKQKFLIPPPPQKGRPSGYQQVKEELPTNKEKFQWITKLLIEDSPIRTGFFIECGANDGEFISPTIKLERHYNWTGLLIEANPEPFKKLLDKKRNAWAANVAACVKDYPEEIVFYNNPKNTGLAGLRSRPEWGVSVNMTVQCIPLYTMIKALDVKCVEYLSLDVEGLELAVLQTLPWDKVCFKIMTIEHGMIPGGQKALTKYLLSKGYRFVATLSDYYTKDSLFVHETLFDKAINAKNLMKT